MEKKRDEEEEEEEKEEFEFLVSKLRRGMSLGKKIGGPHTPVPTWKLVDPTSSAPAPPRRSSAESAAAGASVSARKLGANLWELGTERSGPHRSRRDEILLAHHQYRPQSAGSLRRNAASSLIQQHTSNRRNIQALQPISPASGSSSIGVSTFNHRTSCSGSLDHKGKLREGSYSLKTSTELVKVLNRIWSLEEEQASSVSQVKELKMELKLARARIQELMYEKQTYRHEMDDLMKQIAEDKLIRKRKEHDKIKTAVQSIRDELEDERKLRRKSEGLHRKLVRELSEVKAALSKPLSDLDREKEANGFLENLCDVLAEGVGKYEIEVRELQQKTVKECDHKADRWILHISEAWLDERLHMKIAEARGDIAEKNMIMDRLHDEIMISLQDRQSHPTNDIALLKNAGLRRQSLESVYLNGTTSAPQDPEDADSIASDINCFELNLGGNDSEHHHQIERASENGLENLNNRKIAKIRRKKLGYCGRMLVQNSSNLEVEARKSLSSTKACNVNNMYIMDRLHGIHSHNDTEAESVQARQVEIDLAHMSKDFSSEEVGLNMEMDDVHKSNLLNGNPLKTHSKICEGKDNHINRHGEDFHNQFPERGQSSPNNLNSASGEFCTISSPVQRWKYRTTSSNPEISECSSKLPWISRENTLKAKLLEARLEGRHARLKASKGLDCRNMKN